MSQTRTYFKPVHTSVETAFEQDGYPYGRRGKCLRRVWIETKPKYGQRMVYQTSQPYYPEEGQTAEAVRGKRWNKPHQGQYSESLVLYLDEMSHIHTDGVSVNATPEQFAAFRERAKDGLDEAGLRRVEKAEKVTAAIAALYAKRNAELAAQPHLTAAQVVEKRMAELS